MGHPFALPKGYSMIETTGVDPLLSGGPPLAVELTLKRCLANLQARSAVDQPDESRLAHKDQSLPAVIKKGTHTIFLPASHFSACGDIEKPEHALTLCHHALTVSRNIRPANLTQKDRTHFVSGPRIDQMNCHVSVTVSGLDHQISPASNEFLPDSCQLVHSPFVSLFSQYVLPNIPRSKQRPPCRSLC